MRSRLRNLRLLALSIAHTRPVQLWHRLVRHLRRLSPVGVRVSAPDVTGVMDFSLPLFKRPVWVDRDAGIVDLAGRAVDLSSSIPWDGRGLDDGTGLPHLTLHYMTYLHDVEADAFVRLVDEWVSLHPARDADRAGFPWNPYAVSIRSMVWVHELSRRRGELPQDFVESMEASLAMQLGYLSRRLERDVGGNHLIKNIAALMAGARFFRGPDADRWRSVAERILPAQLDEQILPDGMHFERSFSYHAEVLSDLLVCHEASEPGPLRDRLRDVVRSMTQVLVDGTHPDGGVALFNDAGLGSAPPTADCVAAAARATGAPTPRPRERFDLGAAGYFGWRSADELLIADCGPIGPDHLPAHAHGDVLSFVWSVAGRRLVVDAGVYEYGYGAARRYSRATSSHNTVTVGGSDQAEFWSAFRVGRRPTVTVETLEDLEHGGFRLVGSHDGFERLKGRPVHRRSLEISPVGLTVEDEVVGGDGQPVEARILLHPDADFLGEGDGGIVTVGDTRFTLETSGELAVVEGWWSPDFGVRLATIQIVIGYGPAPAQGTFRLIRRM